MKNNKKINELDTLILDGLQHLESVTANVYGADKIIEELENNYREFSGLAHYNEPLSYDYYEAVREDLKEAIKEHMGYTGQTMDELDSEELKELMQIEDSVTGNASGSYTMNSATSREYVQGNEDLQNEAVEYFGLDFSSVADNLHNWEYWDVSIRIMVLSNIIDEVIEELRQEGENDEDR